VWCPAWEADVLKAILLVDINNLFFGVQEKFGEKARIKHSEYVKKLEDKYELIAKVAFNRQAEIRCGKFMYMLQCRGFETHTSCKQVMLPMALRLADLINQADVIVIGSNYEDCTYLMRWAKEKGKKVVCYAAKVPKAFETYCTIMEVEKDVLDDATDATKQVVMSDHVLRDGYGIISGLSDQTDRP
jgi:hypothetical protein